MDKKKPTSTRISDTSRTAIARIAAETDRSMSYVLNKVIEDWAARPVAQQIATINASKTKASK